MDLFDLYAKITFDSQEFMRGIDQAAEAGKSFGQKFSQSVKQAGDAGRKFGQDLDTWVIAKGAALGNMLSGLASKAMSFAKTLVKSGIGYNVQMEQYTANFKVMLGSAEEAERKLAELADYAKATPFDLTDLADATQTLLSFRVESGKASDVLRRLGDVSLGDKGKLSSLSLAFGQVSAAGKLSGQDLMQMINAGWNPLNDIIARTGETMEEVRERMSAGKIGIDEVTQALVDATSEGGTFFGGMAEGSKTLSGQWSTLKGVVAETLGTLTSRTFEAASSTILPALIEQIEKVNAALERMFGIAREGDSAGIFGEGESPASGLRAWLDEVRGVWSDGQKEDDELVSGYVDGLRSRTQTLAAALEERRAALEAEGADTSELDGELEALAAYEQQIADLLWNRQNKNLTQDDAAELERLIGEISAIEASLSEGMESVEQAGEGPSSAMEGLAAAIGKVGDAVVMLIENWETLKTAGLSGISLAVGFKFAGAARSLLAAFGLSLTGGPMAAIALAGAALLNVAFIWPSDGEVEGYETEHGVKFRSKLDYFVAVKLKMPTDQEIIDFAKQIGDKFSSAVIDFQNWFVDIWNPTLGQLFGTVEKVPKPEPTRKGGGGTAEGGGGGRTESATDEKLDNLAAASDTAATAAEGAGEGMTGAAEAAEKAAESVSGLSGAAAKVTAAMNAAALRINRMGLQGPNALPMESRATGGIYLRETLLSRRGGGYTAVGDAGPEAVLPISTLWQQLDAKLNDAMKQSTPGYETLAAALAARPVLFQVEGRTLMTAVADDTQTALDERERVFVRGMGG